ncbi:uncharacterized protein LAESUDRAFT_729349 [Laetiporus sulphureus 93-53]|uniref:RanBP2-type domain-containing protein n=1 Tax=Laetiporus sulphureus 93-53 TaxID=1314785 RepID=A0A165CRU7_9APHY|nr:uncharacterized protein LAESUDRAFT_729349 [Laetiporus sulphureus 93-53]KZT03322.1 hypothetical protein LAESUDRAFT_729349 [Laetiporus sulphureus 93-53]
MLRDLPYIQRAADVPLWPQIEDPGLSDLLAAGRHVRYPDAPSTMPHKLVRTSKRNADAAVDLSECAPGGRGLGGEVRHFIFAPGDRCSKVASQSGIVHPVAFAVEPALFSSSLSRQKTSARPLCTDSHAHSFSCSYPELPASSRRLPLEYPWAAHPLLAEYFCTPSTASPEFYPLSTHFHTRDSPMRELSVPETVLDSVAGPYTISSNPPNPKTSFRVGDWICTVTNCAAHNFGRNSTCIGCGRHRNEDPQGIMQPPSPSYVGPSANRFSPRFASFSQAQAHYDAFAVQQPLHPSLQRSRTHSSPGSLASRLPSVQQAPMAGQRSCSPYPLLTPSGRALSIGGRVQNVSGDPMTPCIMYWPDNEPLPEQGQIRPLGSSVISYPPIINTGNKGAAEKQPGDWICQKCHYLNWRRRKVCQTCYPYAEGNGDSISATVQAERIALLENVLATQVSRVTKQESTPLPEATRVLLPASERMAYRSPVSPFSPPSPWAPHPQRSASLGLQAHPSPIYQTDGNPATATLLPSFLHEIVQSPSLSPSTSTSSAELSLEEYDEAVLRGYARAERPRAEKLRGTSGSSSSFALPGNSIWKMDGEETKTLSTSGAAIVPPAKKF